LLGEPPEFLSQRGLLLVRIFEPAPDLG